MAAERASQKNQRLLRGGRRSSTAALEEFSARGFAAARLDDVARRADVAKGTIYLTSRTRKRCFRS